MNPSCLVPVPAVGAGLFALSLALGSVIAARPAGAADRELRLTVYNDNLALVSDSRTIQVQAGQSTVELADVPAQIDPTSVHLKPLGSPLEVLEQNFQYDLASPDRILQRYLDQPVDAALKGGELKSGALLSFDGGSLVLRRPDNGVSLVTREKVADLRLPTLPEGLRTRPTLVWLLQAEKGGATPVELSYLTGGLSWHAEYVAVTDEKDTGMELSAWVSLENNSGASYPDARLQLIAGDVQRVTPPPPPMAMRGGRADMMMMAKASEGFAEETFFEYHLYTLDRSTTIADRETKQVSLFPTAVTPVKKVYEYNGQRDAKKVRIILEAENKKELGLGMPLPAGKVRVYKKDSRGDLQFVGEDQIDHTPKNEKLRLGVGKAFDIVAERVELSQDRVTDRVLDRAIQVKLRNRKTEAVEVVVQESVWGDWEIRAASLPFVKKDARTAEFRVPVAADTEAILTFTVRQGSGAFVAGGIEITLRRKLPWIALLYFAQGFPLGVVYDLLPVYFRTAGVSLREIGLLSLLGLPWSLKVFWSPLVDRFGDRRAWSSLCLLGMGGILLVLPIYPPGTLGWGVRGLLLAFTVLSATQDIAIDAYTIGLVRRGEEGAANSLRVSAYRAAIIAVGGGLVALSAVASWPVLLRLAAVVALLLALVVRMAPCVAVPLEARRNVIGPLWTWMRRPSAPAIFLFILLFKVGDAGMGPMVKPFWLDRGLTPAEVGLISTTVGMLMTVLGAVIGGIFVTRVGIFRGLWILGALQAVSNLGYAGVAWLGLPRPFVYAASVFESLTGGMGSAAFLSFLMNICDREQAAVEYALLSAIFGLSRSVAGGFSGWATERLGYGDYFGVTFFLAIPAFVLLPWVRRWVRERSPARAGDCPES